MTGYGTPREAAAAAAEGVRALNHATAHGGGYRWPSDVYDVLGDLASLARRLDQALDQAADWLAGQHVAGRVGVDNRVAVGDAVEDALGDLERARRETGSLALTLESAHAITGHLTGIDPASGRG